MNKPGSYTDILTKCDEGKERGIAKRRKGGLTNDCVPSRDDAIKDAVKHDPMRKQGGHDLPDQPAKCSSYKRTERLKLPKLQIVDILKK